MPNEAVAHLSWRALVTYLNRPVFDTVHTDDVAVETVGGPGPEAVQPTAEPEHQ